VPAFVVENKFNLKSSDLLPIVFPDKSSFSDFDIHDLPIFKPTLLFQMIFLSLEKANYQAIYQNLLHLNFCIPEILI
jgi:hypothetical protein